MSDGSFESRNAIRTILYMINFNVLYCIISEILTTFLANICFNELYVKSEKREFTCEGIFGETCYNFTGEFHMDWFFFS